MEENSRQRCRHQRRSQSSDRESADEDNNIVKKKNGKPWPQLIGGKTASQYNPYESHNFFLNDEPPRYDNLENAIDEETDPKKLKALKRELEREKRYDAAKASVREQRGLKISTAPVYMPRSKYYPTRPDPVYIDPLLMRGQQSSRRQWKEKQLREERQGKPHHGLMVVPEIPKERHRKQRESMKCVDEESDERSLRRREHKLPPPLPSKEPSHKRHERKSTTPPCEERRRKSHATKPAPYEDFMYQRQERKATTPPPCEDRPRKRHESKPPAVSPAREEHSRKHHHEPLPPRPRSLTKVVEPEEDMESYFIGPQNPSQVVKHLKPNEFRLYYQVPEKGVCYKLRLFLAYMSSENEEVFHFPIVCSKNCRTGEDMWSLRYTESATFPTLPALIKYHKTYAYMDPSTGKIDTFPVWKGAIIDDDTS